MAIMTFSLRTIGLGNLAALSPVVEFHPSGNALGTIGTIYAAKPESCVPEGAAGDGSVNLRSTPSVRSPADFHYKLRIKYRDPTAFGPDAGMSVVEFPDWKIYVPEEGGNLTDYIEDSSSAGNPLVLWTSVNPPLAFTTNTWWFNPDTSVLMKWSA